MSTPNVAVDGSSDRAPPDSDITSLRSKVVEILSNTANGCLTELGYYPGMAKRMEELEKENARWQQENVKLFQDNRNLAQALHAQDEHSRQTVASLESKIQALTNEKALLVQHNETILANGLAGIPNQQLLLEYKRLHGLYAAARTEIQQLRDYIDKITLSQHIPPVAGSVHQSPSQGATFPLQDPNDRVEKALSVFSDWKRQSTSHGHASATASPSLGTNQTPSLPPNVTPSQTQQVVPPPPSVTPASVNPAAVASPRDILPPSRSSSSNVQSPQPHTTPSINRVGDSHLHGQSESLSAPPSNAAVPSPSSDNLAPSAAVPRVPAPIVTPPPALNHDPENNNLKRTHDVVADTEGQPSKKPRVEGQDSNEKTTKDGEESDDEIVEIGPDGLRLIEDCVSALMDEEEGAEGVLHCKLCVARYDMGYSSDPPQPFVNATIEQLAVHCSSEHEDAWNAVRQGS